MPSVKPTITLTIEQVSNHLTRRPQVVPGKTGINLKYENRELGSDRIVNAVAAYELYGGLHIYRFFGTATTFGAVRPERGEFWRRDFA